MTPVTRLKLGLAAVALVLFVVGARMDLPAVRWVAIGLLLIAVVLRFYRPRA